MSAIANRMIRSSMAIRPTIISRAPVAHQNFHLSRQMRHNEQNPRSKLSSETPGSSMGQSTYLTIAAAGLGLGACFFYLMSGPAEAVQIPGEDLKTKNFDTRAAK